MAEARPERGMPVDSARVANPARTVRGGTSNANGCPVLATWRRRRAAREEPPTGRRTRRALAHQQRLRSIPGHQGGLMGTAMETNSERGASGWDAPTGVGQQTKANWTGMRTVDGKGESLANFLGWFSVGLGAAQMLAPKQMSRLVGASEDDNTTTMRWLCGLRELSVGLGILTTPRPEGWMWARVAGDMADLAMLGVTYSNGEPVKTTGATLAVLGVTALDIIAAQELSARAKPTNWTSTPDGSIRVRRSVTIGKEPAEVYGFWRNFENLPRFMEHLESVRTTGDRRSHWVAKGPAGTTVEWDAEITDDVPNERIAWRSVGEAAVENEGAVLFRPSTGRGTEVLVDLTYRVPGGKLGSVVAKLFREEPGQQIAQDLAQFKQVLEIGEVLLSNSTVKSGPHVAKPHKGDAQSPKVRANLGSVGGARAAAESSVGSNR
jgi:uncharacterized membrane protein